MASLPEPTLSLDEFKATLDEMRTAINTADEAGLELMFAELPVDSRREAHLAAMHGLLAGAKRAKAIDLPWTHFLACDILCNLMMRKCTRAPQHVV